MVEITSEEQNKVRRTKRTEDSLRDLWDNIKSTNIWIKGVPEEEEKMKVYENIFEEIIVENFPDMEKEIVNQVQDAQRVPYRINPKRNMLTKTKHKERTLKAARNKQQVYKGNPICLTADFSRNSAGQKGMAGYILSTEREKSTTKITVPGKDLIQNWWRNKKISRQAKVKRIQ